jgi:hypothetical protein
MVELLECGLRAQQVDALLSVPLMQGCVSKDQLSHRTKQVFLRTLVSGSETHG